MRITRKPVFAGVFGVLLLAGGLSISACTPAERQEACAIDQAAQPIIVPVEGAIGLAVLPAAPFIAVGHVVAGVGCAVILAAPAAP